MDWNKFSSPLFSVYGYSWSTCQFIFLLWKGQKKFNAFYLFIIPNKISFIFATRVRKWHCIAAIRWSLFTPLYRKLVCPRAMIICSGIQIYFGFHTVHVVLKSAVHCFMGSSCSGTNINRVCHEHRRGRVYKLQSYCWINNWPRVW